jgi:hypothetical protein
MIRHRSRIHASARCSVNGVQRNGVTASAFHDHESRIFADLQRSGTLARLSMHEIR